MLITEAIITSLDRNSTEFTVRIPLFESAGDDTKAILPARIIIQPGNYSMYNVGDYVWVTFAGTQIEIALILGKIYQGASAEINNNTGGISLNTLHVLGYSATLPQTTQLSSAPADYNTITKLINKIKDLEIQNEINIQKFQALQDKFDSLDTKIKVVEEAAGLNLAYDAEGELLHDADDEPMQYASDDGTTLETEGEEN